MPTAYPLVINPIFGSFFHSPLAYDKIVVSHGTQVYIRVIDVSSIFSPISPEMPAVTPITVTHESPLSAPSYYHAIFEPGMTYPDSIPESEPLLVSGVNIGQHYTFERLRRDVLTFSTILREEFNVKRQDVVTLYAPNDVRIITI